MVEPFSRKLTNYGFNHSFALVDDDKFWSTIRISENFLLHLFQLHQWLPDRKRIMLGCYLFKNCNRWRTIKRKSVVSKYNKILFFSASLLFGYFVHKWFKRNHVIWHFLTMYFGSFYMIYLQVFCFQLRIIGFQYQQFFLV